MYLQTGPTVWHGLPDLRDLAKDNTIWSELPIPIYQAGLVMNITKQTTYKIAREQQVKTIMRFGRIHIQLKELPQTARCAFIEHMFKEKISMDNILHRSDEVQQALSIGRQNLSNMVRDGRIVREYMPNAIPRYPHWGFDQNAKEMLIKYIANKKNTENLQKE